MRIYKGAVGYTVPGTKRCDSQLQHIHDTAALIDSMQTAMLIQKLNSNEISL
jgi:hypothetical protein